MKKILTIEGFCPFDLLRLDRDAFYDVVNDKFNKENNIDAEVTDMELCNKATKDGIVIEATVISFKEVA